MTIQWSLVLFTVLSGCGAGLFACTALDEFRGGAASKVRLPACAVAVALLVVGGIASATHLSHVDRMMAVLAHPTAGIFLEALLLGLLARHHPEPARRSPRRVSCWPWRSRSPAACRT